MPDDQDAMMPRFRDRRDAGRALARELTAYGGRSDVVVLALPRGGVPVGYEVATALHAPLDVFAVRKLGVPGHEELAFGAISSGGAEVLNHAIVNALNIPRSALDAIVAAERAELERRNHLYRDGRAAPRVTGRVVLLVDDGLATGASMLVAVEAIRKLQPARIVVAVPVGPRDTCELLRRRADEVACACMPARFDGVGAAYADFSQTSDDEVRALLGQAADEECARATRE